MEEIDRLLRALYKAFPEVLKDKINSVEISQEGKMEEKKFVVYHVHNDKFDAPIWLRFDSEKQAREYFSNYDQRWWNHARVTQVPPEILDGTIKYSYDQKYSYE